MITEKYYFGNLLKFHLLSNFLNYLYFFFLSRSSMEIQPTWKFNRQNLRSSNSRTKFKRLFEKRWTRKSLGGQNNQLPVYVEPWTARGLQLRVWKKPAREKVPAFTRRVARRGACVLKFMLPTWNSTYLPAKREKVFLNLETFDEELGTTLSLSFSLFLSLSGRGMKIKEN